MNRRELFKMALIAPLVKMGLMREQIRKGMFFGWDKGAESLVSYSFAVKDVDGWHFHEFRKTAGGWIFGMDGEKIEEFNRHATVEVHDDL